jgi:hypothetical protein
VTRLRLGLVLTLAAAVLTPAPAHGVAHKLSNLKNTSGGAIGVYSTTSVQDRGTAEDEYVEVLEQPTDVSWNNRYNHSVGLAFQMGDPFAEDQGIFWPSLDIYYGDGVYPTHNDRYTKIFSDYYFGPGDYQLKISQKVVGDNGHWNVYLGSTNLGDYWWPYPDHNLAKTQLENGYDYGTIYGTSMGRHANIHLQGHAGDWQLQSSKWPVVKYADPPYFLTISAANYSWSASK